MGHLRIRSPTPCPLGQGGSCPVVAHLQLRQCPGPAPRGRRAMRKRAHGCHNQMLPPRVSDARRDLWKMPLCLSWQSMRSVSVRSRARPPRLRRFSGRPLSGASALPGARFSFCFGLLTGCVFCARALAFPAKQSLPRPRVGVICLAQLHIFAGLKRTRRHSGRAAKASAC